TLPDRGATHWNAGIVHVRLDAAGRRISAGCEREVAREVDIARWPVLAYPWLARAQREAAHVPALAAGCAADALDAADDIRIDGVADRSSIARAPNSDKPARLRLRALGSRGEVSWLVNGRLAGSTVGAAPFEREFP